jgi:5-hydroxyisourate hydrolase
MSGITTHVLDTASGAPAVGLSVLLERSSGDRWERLGTGRTDADGRVTDLLAPGTTPAPGVYRLTFDTSLQSAFYPEVTVVFTVADTGDHYHVPLLLGRYQYTTYRGS